jgi:hypothetical protein
MVMHEALRVILSGEMPQEKLDNLRNLLGLTREGRLSDDEDAEFGYRRDRTNRTKISLYRHTPAKWQVKMTYQSEPPPIEVVQQLRSDVLSAASHLGLTVVDVR